MEKCKMCDVLNDKIFYVYLTLIVIVIIIGCSYLMLKEQNNFVCLLWVIANLIFLLFIYYFEKINIIKNSKYLYFIRFTFLIIIILQLIWAIEFNKSKKIDLNIPIILIIIISVGYCAISYRNKQKWALIYSFIYTLIWIYIIIYYSILNFST